MLLISAGSSTKNISMIELSLALSASAKVWINPCSNKCKHDRANSFELAHEFGVGILEGKLKVKLPGGPKEVTIATSFRPPYQPKP